jgi:dihydrofolate synthase / folylpolyglutamate synthase
MLDYKQCLDFLYTQLPMFTRDGSSAYKPGLDNILKLSQALGNPHQKFKSIHIAGTNGKGSTSHSVAAILQVAGYKTGLFTSPHLKSFTERIRVNGKEIHEDYIITFVNSHLELINKIKPSFFEITTLMAFDYFAHSKVDIAVIEVGLGGRLDATNIITPILSVITNISLDHTDLLGNTLAEIAFEKGGIIKPNVPVIIGERNTETQPVFEKIAFERESIIIWADEFEIIKKEKEAADKLTVDVFFNKLIYIKNLKFDLKGEYQTQNIKVILSILDMLTKLKLYVDKKHIVKALDEVVWLTSLKGRWQILNREPLVICDIGHNEAGIKEIVKSIHKTAYKNLFLLIGMAKDKDYKTILNHLPKNGYYFFCQANIPRALDAEFLYEKAKEIGLSGEVCKNVNKALIKAKSMASINDLIFIGGSNYIVAELDGI